MWMCCNTWPLSTQAALLRGRPWGFRFQAGAGLQSYQPGQSSIKPQLRSRRSHPPSRMRNRLDFKRCPGLFAQPHLQDRGTANLIPAGFSSDRDVPKQRATPGNRSVLGQNSGGSAGSFQDARVWGRVREVPGYDACCFPLCLWRSIQRRGTFQPWGQSLHPEGDRAAKASPQKEGASVGGEGLEVPAPHSLTSLVLMLAMAWGVGGIQNIRPNQINGFGVSSDSRTHGNGNLPQEAPSEMIWVTDCS